MSKSRVRKSDLLRYRMQGLSNKTIAVVMDCSIRTVERAITRYKLAPKRIEVDAATLVDLRTRAPKMSWAQIAKHFNCSQRAIYKKRRVLEKEYAINIP